MTDLNAEAAFIEVEAGVRYWEDATVNGVEDEAGTLIPLRVKDEWCPTINLAMGRVSEWPTGTTAEVHYKVCDAGRYWLLDKEGNRIATRDGYVPGQFLCHGDNGYGDYIIMKIDGEGKIADYHRPSVEPDEWRPLPPRQ